jgi:hypothetical protein
MRSTRVSQHRWITFLRNHRELIAAMDFFVVPTVRFHLLYVWFAIDHGRRRILHFNVTANPVARFRVGGGVAAPTPSMWAVLSTPVLDVVTCSWSGASSKRPDSSPGRSSSVPATW